MTGAPDLKLAILSGEVDSLTESSGDMRRAIAAVLQRIEKLEDEVATLRAAHEAAVMRGSVQGIDGEVTVTTPPEWGGGVPLVEIAERKGQ